MTGILAGVALGALKPLVEKLAKALGDEYKRFKGVHAEIKSLVLELEAMHAFLLRMSEHENPDEEDKAWAKEVRELSYDMEDSLDEFMLRVDGGKSAADPHGLLDKCKNFLKKLRARQKVAKEIEQLTIQVKQAAERSQRYKDPRYNVKNTSNTCVDPRVLAIFEDASRIVGIDGPKADLIKLLAIDDKCASSENTKVVSIFGSGGIGKTTLASQVYQQLKGRFECGAFLSVSRTPDMTKILRTILSEVTGKPYGETEAGGDEQLIWKIKENLQDKRYLFVIDDIWKGESWEFINRALFKNKEHSRIVTTTRLRDVARSCCSSDGDIVHEMEPLSFENSKKLFLERLFGSVGNCPKNLVDLSDKILKKCDGIPLAVIAISGLLANKQGKHEWDQVHTSIGRGLEKDPHAERMRQILALSYFDLPHHLRACLLYLSVFPEDSVIARWRLVRRWIAEGFIQKERGKKLQEFGEGCFTELINRSLIQARMIKDGEVTACQVHDTILDFIVQKSEEENFITLFGDGYEMHSSGSKVRRLSLHVSSQEKVSKLMTEQDLSHVRSVTVFDYTMEVELPLWSKFRFLRVLDLEGCTQVKDHHLAKIGEFFQLKYLSLHVTRVSELPGQIGKLQYLETLELRKSNITALPDSVAQLSRLAYLAVDDGVKLPDEIGSMTALEDLVGCASRQSVLALGLGPLKNLGKVSLFLSSSNSSGAEEFRLADIHVLGRLPALVSLKVLSHESFKATRPMTIRSNDGFPRLKQFVHRCNVPVMFDVGAMPELEKLGLIFMFSSLRIDQLLDSNGPFGIQHLSCLESVYSVVHYGNAKNLVDWIGKRIIQMENKGFRLGKEMADMIYTLAIATCSLLEAKLRQDPHTFATKTQVVHKHPKFPKMKLTNGTSWSWSNHDLEETFPDGYMQFIKNNLSEMLGCETPVVLGIKDKDEFSTVIRTWLEDTSDPISLCWIEDNAYPATIGYLKQTAPNLFKEEDQASMNWDDYLGVISTFQATVSLEKIHGGGGFSGCKKEE